MKTKIFDCSNSSYRPQHRDVSFGQKENDIMALLKTHSALFDCEYVSDAFSADTIITNDVFPPEVLSLGKHLVKRMDGIFWDARRDDNIPLNNAAVQADHVIFISEYSRRAYETLYGCKLKETSVVLNEVCNSKFYINDGVGSKRFSWTAVATNWRRKEKRFDDVVNFAEMIGTGGVVNLIGDCPFDVPDNVIRHGYCTEAFISNVLRSSTAFLNLSYRDAAPKVVCQAVSCGLPVLYADSGGTREVVFAGVPIKDRQDISFEDNVPSLDEKEMEKSWHDFFWRILDISRHARAYKSRFTAMLDGYFSVIKNK